MVFHSKYYFPSPPQSSNNCYQTGPSSAKPGNRKMRNNLFRKTFMTSLRSIAQTKNTRLMGIKHLQRLREWTSIEIFLFLKHENTTLFIHFQRKSQISFPQTIVISRKTPNNVTSRTQSKGEHDKTLSALKEHSLPLQLLPSFVSLVNLLICFHKCYSMATFTISA